MIRPKATVWHLITSGVVSEDNAHTLLSVFSDERLLGDWTWTGTPPLTTLAMIETNTSEEMPLPEKAVKGLINLNLQWAWVRKGPCIKNARIYLPSQNLDFHPQGNTAQEQHLVQLLVDIHTWPPLRSPSSAHEHLDALNRTPW